MEDVLGCRLFGQQQSYLDDGTLCLHPCELCFYSKQPKEIHLYSGTRLYISTFLLFQGPLPATCAEFWYMIVQESCSAILMLCNYIEMGTNKCAQYFPTKVGQTMNFGATEEIKVTAKTSDFVSLWVYFLQLVGFQFKFTIDTKVKIMVTQLEVQVNGNTHNTTHYHWQDWPDRGVPEADMAPIMLLAHLEKELVQTIN